VKDPKELARLRGLYEYVWQLSPPKHSTAHVPHNLLVYLVKVAPKEKEKEFVVQRLSGYGYQVDPKDPRFEERFDKAMNWAKEVETITTGIGSVDEKEREAILELAGVINASNDENYLQNSVFTIAKKHNLEPGSFFKTLYRVLIGSDHGPRLGPYILAMGRENVASALAGAARTANK
jgi:lysyl-tRNA synthetase, class I